jgi:ADP-L-glycero-D-manno-heptose 6-epimerase
MKILLTGHKGFIGSYMLNALADHEVTTYDWSDGGRPSVMGYDWVVHLGGISSTTERDIDKILRQNTEFSIALYEECKTFGVNMQYASSASVYGLGIDFRESAPVDPRNPYAWSKYLFERYVEQNPTGSIVQGFRYFNVYSLNGAGEEHKANQASPFYQFYQQSKTGEIRVFEDSEDYKRDFVPVEEVIDIHLKFLNVKESGVFNIGSGKPMSFLDIANTFNVKVVEIPMPEILKSSYQKYTCADMTKTRKTLANIQIR